MPPRAALPLIARNAFASVAARVVRELTLEGCGEREAASPLYLGGCRRERLVGRLCRTVHHERSTGQGLERRADRTVGVVVMRPGKTSTQGENGIRHRPGFV